MALFKARLVNRRYLFPASRYWLEFGQCSYPPPEYHLTWPSTHSSGGKTYHGKITSEGNRWLRWALVEAAVPASYADAEIKERLDTFRKKKGTNVAKTAMARWLLKVVYHVLKERRPYITAYNKLVKERSRLLKRLANPQEVDCAV